MKIKRKIAAVLLVTALLVITALFIGAETATYSGTVAGAEAIIAEIEESVTVSRKETKLNELTEYLATVDPSEEGYAELLAKVDNKELEVAYLFVVQSSEKTLASEKSIAVGQLSAFLAQHPFADSATATHNGTPVTVESYRAALEAEKTAVVTAYITESAAAQTAENKHQLLDALLEFMNNYSITLTPDNAALVTSENFACAKLYLASVSADDGTAKLGATLRLLASFGKEHTLPTEGAEWDAYIADLAAKREVYNAKIAANKAELEKYAHVYDYNDTPPFDLDFDDADVGALTNELHIENGEEITRIGIESGADGDNKYFTVHYDQAKHFRTNLYLSSVENSLVFECDITTFDNLPKNNIWCEDVGVNGDLRWSVMYFQILPNGDLASGKSNAPVLVNNAVTKGEWTHISVVVDYQDNIMKLYVDYELVEERSTAQNGRTYVPQMIRLGGNPGTKGPGGEFSIDNVRAYSGYAPRDIRASAALSDTDKLATFVARFNDPALDPVARLEYYNEAGKLASLLRKDPLPAEVAAFDAITKQSVAEVTKLAADANSDKYLGYVRSLTDLAVGEATNVDRTFWLSRVDAFLVSTAGVYTADSDFEEASAAVGRIRAELDYEKSAAEFVKYVNGFYAASSVDKQIVQRDLAKEAYAFLDLTYLSNAEAFPSFTEAMSKYPAMDTIIAENEMIENSRKLYSLIRYVSEYKTEAEWAANYDFLKNYVALARELINEGNYDVYYNNLDKVVKNFAPMNEYFYARLQAEHIAHLGAELARFDASVQYFEKYGIAVMMQEYAQRDDVDKENAEIAAILAKNETNLAALLADEANYEKLLADNTALFVAKCAELVGAIDYTAMKRVVGEASVYFYSMNVNDATAQDALAIYITRRDEVKRAESYAEKFISSVAMITVAETVDASFKAMVESGMLLPDVERKVAGVDAAIATLDGAVADYNASIAGINDELEETSKLAAYLTNLSGRDSLLTLILHTLFS